MRETARLERIRQRVQQMYDAMREQHSISLLTYIHLESIRAILLDAGYRIEWVGDTVTLQRVEQEGQP